MVTVTQEGVDHDVASAVSAAVDDAGNLVLRDPAGGVVTTAYEWQSCMIVNEHAEG